MSLQFATNSLFLRATSSNLDRVGQASVCRTVDWGELVSAGCLKIRCLSGNSAEHGPPHSLRLLSVRTARHPQRDASRRNRNRRRGLGTALIAKTAAMPKAAFPLIIADPPL